jgi:hypothetical protein
VIHGGSSNIGLFFKMAIIFIFIKLLKTLLEVFNYKPFATYFMEEIKKKGVVG